MLRTHDLELEQRRNMKGNKAKTMALKADSNPVKVKTRSSTMGKDVAVYADSSDNNDESESDPDVESKEDLSDDELVQIVANTGKRIQEEKFINFTICLFEDEQFLDMKI